MDLWDSSSAVRRDNSVRRLLTRSSSAAYLYQPSAPGSQQVVEPFEQKTKARGRDREDKGLTGLFAENFFQPSPSGTCGRLDIGLGSVQFRL